MRYGALLSVDVSVYLMTVTTSSLCVERMLVETARGYLAAALFAWACFAGSAEVSGSREGLHYAIREEVENGVTVADIVADAGLHEYGVEVLKVLRFKFLNQPTCRVTIDERTGHIRTSGRIDREALCDADAAACQVRLDIVVQPMEYFRIVRVSLDILDVNDNAPLFSPPSVVREMLESSPLGSAVLLFPAVDFDTSAFAVRRYDLRSSHGGPTGRFELRETRKHDGSTDLRLVLVEPLDRELYAQHRLTVTAVDGGDPPRHGSLNVVVVVTDVNDNAPVFDRDAYDVSVPENCPLHSTVLRIHATDRDAGRNAELTYFLGPSSTLNFGGTFLVDNATGDIIVIGTVDYEATPVYQLMVSVKDNGPDSVSADTMVTIRVVDANDNSPRITVNTLAASDARSAAVPENALLGTFVAHVIVKDPDGDVSGHVTCDLSGDEAFALKQMFNDAHSEFQIVTADRTLDRELRSSYYLEITCKDGGQPQKSSTSHVTIDVTDVNDNVPTFVQSLYAVEMDENNPEGQVIVRVQADDGDSGDNADVVYSIAAGDEDGLFDVHPTLGLVRASRSLDRETRDRHRVVVLAVDRGIPTALTGTAVVEVTVADLNDERPAFVAESFVLTVRENLPGGTTVGTVTAIDADAPPFDRFSYGLRGSTVDVSSSEDDRGFFSIDHRSGRIFTTRSLDREDADVHRVIVVASDDGNRSLSSTAVVTIHVQDVNDHAPVFLRPEGSGDDRRGAVATVAVSNRAVRGHYVARVEATDQDAGRNGQVVYSIERGNEKALFRINSTSGVLTADIDFHGERDNQVVVLKVMASDRGTPRLYSFMELTVVVNRSTGLPLGLRNQQMLFSASPVGPRPARIAPATIGALSIASALLVATVTAGVVVVLLLRHRRRRKRRHGDRMDRVVKALTVSGGHVIQAEGQKVDDKTKHFEDDDDDDDENVRVSVEDLERSTVTPDILSRSPRRLRRRYDALLVDDGRPPKLRCGSSWNDDEEATTTTKTTTTMMMTTTIGCDDKASLQQQQQQLKGDQLENDDTVVLRRDSAGQRQRQLLSNRQEYSPSRSPASPTTNKPKSAFTIASCPHAVTSVVWFPRKHYSDSILSPTPANPPPEEQQSKNGNDGLSHAASAFKSGHRLKSSPLRTDAPDASQQPSSIARLTSAV